jgi:hypothetical protein
MRCVVKCRVAQVDTADFKRFQFQQVSMKGSRCEIGLLTYALVSVKRH